MSDDDDKLDDEDRRILAMTEEELRADFAAQGLDWNTEVARVKSACELAIADVEFAKWQRNR